jgi:hypothetical protein
MNLNHPNSTPTAEQKTVNLTLSLIWVLVCATLLVFISLNEESPSVTTSHPLIFLFALPALYGIYVWRRISMNEATLSKCVPAKSTQQTAVALPELPFSFLEGLTPISKLTWLAQGLASTCLVLITLATLRPLLLASLIAVGLVFIEIHMLLCYWISATDRASPTSTPPSLPMVLSSAHVAETKPTLEQDDSIDEPTASQDDNYQTLMTLREQIEAGEASDATPETSSPAPQETARQTVRDFRNAAGYGTISGESSVAIPAENNLVIITLAFMPPFPSSPELLADCEDDRVDSVRVLQCQALGSKIEIKFRPEAITSDSEDVMLLWEAMLERS